MYEDMKSEWIDIGTTVHANITSMLSTVTIRPIVVSMLDDRILQL